MSRSPHHHGFPEDMERKPEVEDDEIDEEEPLDLSTYQIRSNPNYKTCETSITGKSNLADDIGYTIPGFRQFGSPLRPSFPPYMTPNPSVSGELQVGFPGIRDSFPAILPPVGTVNTRSSGPTYMRPILRTRGKERSLLTCSVCLKAFDRPSLLKRHMRTHTGEKPHVCDVCSKGFSTSSSLNTHRRIHSGEKPHQCPICGKRFTASSNLYYHRMTHSKEKPHKCLTCGKSFPTPGDLRSHQYVHSGSWPHNCPVCQRGFSKHTNLRNHLLLHSGDKPHSCGKCGKKFALACNLRAHFKTHEEDQQEAKPRSAGQWIKCGQCSRRGVTMAHDGLCQMCAILQPVQAGVKVDTIKNTRRRIMAAGSGSVGNRDRIRSHHDPSPEPSNSGHQIPSVRVQQPPLEDQPSVSNGESEDFRISPSPFLDQLISWNSQFVRETTGFVQQKFLESQFMASQFLISAPPFFQSSSSSQQLISSNFPRVDELVFPFTFPLRPLCLPPLVPTTVAPDWSLELTNENSKTFLE